jgi:hypothetical protein
MSFNFPNSPAEGQMFNPSGGPTFIFTNGVWASYNVPRSKTLISDSPPSGAVHGDLWWESDSGNLYVFYDDGNSQQWVQVNMPQTATDTAQLVALDFTMSVSPLNSSGGALYLGYVEAPAPYLASTRKVLGFSSRNVDLTPNNFSSWFTQGTIFRIAPASNIALWDEFVLLTPPYDIGAGVGTYPNLYGVKWRGGANQEFIDTTPVKVTYIGRSSTAVDDNLLVNPLMKVSQQNGDTTSSSTATSVYYCADQWAARWSAGAVTGGINSFTVGRSKSPGYIPSLANGAELLLTVVGGA